MLERQNEYPAYADFQFTSELLDDDSARYSQQRSHRLFSPLDGHFATIARAPRVQTKQLGSCANGRC